MTLLTKTTVLVPNRHYQTINASTPQEVCCMMSANAATGPEIESEEHIRPLTWTSGSLCR